MAIYHLSVKTISRSAGRSATAAAAYRAGVEITDKRTGEIHDYTRKGGVESSDLVLPDYAPEWAHDRERLWNEAELSETRKNSTVAREFEIALPSELSVSERKRLAIDFAKEIVERHGCAADVSIHAPGNEGDNRNHHAHILVTTRRIGKDGFNEKTRELDDLKTGEVTRWRARFADLQNARLRENKIEARVDHRTLEAQGIDREPTSHKGVTVSAMERKGKVTDVGQRIQSEANERLKRSKELGEIERANKQIDRSLIDVSSDLKAAIAERNQHQAEQDRLRKLGEDYLRKQEIEAKLKQKLAPTPADKPLIITDLRQEIHRDVDRLTDGRAVIVPFVGGNRGVIFAENEQYLAADAGRSQVKIIERDSIQGNVGLGLYDISNGKAKQLPLTKDSIEHLYRCYGKNVTEQLEQALTKVPAKLKTIQPDHDLDKDHGMER